MIERCLIFSLQHRFLILLSTLAVAALGAWHLQQLPIDAVPDITNNQVAINTEAPALSPEDIEKQVTFPVETALAGIPGLDYTRSISRNGFSQVTAVFHDDVDIYFARAQVNERLLQARADLPEGAAPQMGAISTGLGEIYMWTVEFQHPRGQGSNTQPGEPGWQPDGSYLTPEGQRLNTAMEHASYLRTVQDWIIQPQLKGVPGVAGVDAIGGYVREYHVQPIPEKLLALGLSLPDIVEAIERNNRSVGAGFIEQNGEALAVRANGRITNMGDMASIVITNRNGLPIHLRDVATIGIGKELRTGSASSNGNEAVVGTALMLIGGNSRTVAAAVDTKLADINRSLPPDIQAKTVMNRTKLVDATIHTVQKNLTEGALLVIAILFALLGNVRAALIAALVIPVAMLATAIGMVRTGISGNLMSLGALDFGLIVDGAVIITENGLRRLAERQHHLGRPLSLQERLHEVMIASKEMIQPTVFGQAIIIMVYLPLLSFSGVEGKMFEPMAMTVILALVAAFILSLTFVPAMLAIFVSGPVQEKENPVIRGLQSAYAPWLRRAMQKPLTVAAVAASVFLASLLLFRTLGQEFIPTLDEKDIAMHAMRIPSTGITQSQTMQSHVETVLGSIPEVAFVFSKTGTAEMASDPMPPNVSDTFIILKSRDQWPEPDKTKNQLIRDIQDKLTQAPGNNYEFTQPIQMRFNELISGVRSDVAVKLYGDDFTQLESTAQRIAQALRATPGAADVKVEQTSGLPFLEITPRKDAIARYGLNVSDVLSAVQIALGGREAGLVFEGDKRFAIIVRLPEEIRQNQKAIGNLPILLPAPERTDNSTTLHPNPGFVPLRELADITTNEGINQISRENGKRRIVIQANVRNRDIGTFVEEAKNTLATSVTLPAGYWLDWGGQFKNLEDAKQRLAVVVPVCFFMIFLLLFTALDSAKQALLVFSAVPLALSGGVISLWLRDMPFSISAAVGFIALSGVAVLNGLVMINSFNLRARNGTNPEMAVYEGAMSRVRPVMMTALVASFGFIPMALATGAGAEVQKPLATVVIGGLITATFLTLLLLPALYLATCTKPSED